MRAIESPPPAGDHSSSSAPTDEREISRRLSSSSSSVTPSFFAISSSVGARCSSFSSAAIARSIWRARVRTERGTQSSERSSSMIAPRMRAIAKVSNLISRDGSKRSIAPMRPRSPYETRSCSSTCAGRLAPTRPATNFTSGAYVRIRRSRSSWSLDFRYSCQSVWVWSAAATAREYAARRQTPQARRRTSARRARSAIQAASAAAAIATTQAAPPWPRGVDRKQEERGRDRHEEQPEKMALHGRNGATRRRGTIPPQLRGVAQLAERWSPKPEVAGSIPVAPARHRAKISSGPTFGGAPQVPQTKNGTRGGAPFRFGGSWLSRLPSLGGIPTVQGFKRQVVALLLRPEVAERATVLRPAQPDGLDDSRRRTFGTSSAG